MYSSIFGENDSRCGNEECTNNNKDKFSESFDISSLKRCSRCKSTLYCSVECQKIHWFSGHSSVCNALSTTSKAIGKDRDTSSSTDNIKLESMDPDSLKALVLNTGTLLCLEVPPGTEIGIDDKSWITGVKFSGIKFIPQGLHYLTFSLKGKHGDISPIIGNFFEIKLNEVVIWKYSPKEEELIAVNNTDDIQRFSSAVRRFEFDSMLGTYPRDLWHSWNSLTNTILSSRILTRLHIDDSNAATTITTFPYTILPGQRRDSKRVKSLLVSCPGDITAFGMDSSQVLVKYISMFSLEEVMGELQYSFIDFLCGQALDGLTQWKSLVDILCRCEDFYTTRALRSQDYGDFSTKALECLFFQLQKIPRDFFVDELSQDNFLRASLKRLFEIRDSIVEILNSPRTAAATTSSTTTSTMIYQDHIQREIVSKIDLIKTFAASSFIWDDMAKEVISDSDDLPTVVELDSDAMVVEDC